MLLRSNQSSFALPHKFEAPPLTTISRRSFLQLSGIALAAFQFSPIFRQAEHPQTIYGRALTALPLFQGRDTQRSIASHIWPDSVVPILDSSSDWYTVPGGYVSRAGLQPMHNYTANNTQQLTNFPEWAEVTGTVAIVRSYCAANAPLVTRIGHGGIARVVDYLPGSPIGWYAIADYQNNLLGWSQTSVWSSVQMDTSSQTQSRLEIDSQNHFLRAFEDNHQILEASCTLNDSLQPGTYHWTGRQIGSGSYQLGSETIHGIPWQTYFGDGQAIAGVYWHNQFGSQQSGPSIQVTPFLARWLYGWLNTNSVITII